VFEKFEEKFLEICPGKEMSHGKSDTWKEGNILDTRPEITDSNVILH
jgi:hypothetical protein